MLTFIFKAYYDIRPKYLEDLVNPKLFMLRQATKDEVERFRIKDELNYSNPKNTHTSKRKWNE